jgi:hypothetical protein
MEIENPPSERREDQAGMSRYHFQVEERFSGVDTNEIDVYSGRGGADCSFHFQEGKQYVVFPYRAGGRLVATVCSNTRLTSDAEAFLPQLRAMRDGQKVASLYGVLRRTQQPYESTWQDDFDQPIGNTEVRLVSGKRSRKAKTDNSGVFAFYDVPEGKYKFEADLPANLVLAQAILSDPLPPIELPGRACFEHDLEALPTGRIRGRVLGPDGQPLDGVGVDLFRADRYKEGELGWWEYQDNDKRMFFEFDHVSPGDYILVFNDRNRLDPYAPYPRTFYPSSVDILRAERLHVTEGERLANADIHVTGGKPTRELTVRVTGDQYQQAHSSVSAKGTVGDPPLTTKVSFGVYKLPLLREADYDIYASYFCDPDGYHPFEVETLHVKVSGADDSTSEVILAFTETQSHCP